MTTLHLRKLIGQSPLRLSLLLIPLVLACFALSPGAQAVVPPPDGGYPGSNTAEGTQALQNLGAGVWNTALGFQTLFNDTTGSSNTATGLRSLFSNVNGVNNTANGVQALYFNTTGSDNTAIGLNALRNNTTGSGNTGLGFNAGFNLTIGNGNVCIGTNVGGIPGEMNTTRIRNIWATVQPVVGINPDYVIVNNQGRLGRANISSRRYKHDIKLMDKASEALFELKPVSFRYNEEYDATQTIAFGLIAEDVAEVYPDLVGRNAEGQPESVRYEQINAMLLNEFLKEHKKVEEQQSKIENQQAAIALLKSTVAQQQKGMEVLTAQLQEQAAQIQKVSTQLEMSKPAAKVVVNKP